MTSPRLFDSHAHVNFAAFQDDWQGVLDDCQRHGVAVTLVGSQLATSRRAIELAEHYPHGVYAAVGLHPVHVADQPVPFAIADYAALMSSSAKVVAVGETGVDYYRLPAGREQVEMKRQRAVFVEHLRLARAQQKALVMHTRERATGPKGAYRDLLGLLQGEQHDGLPRGVIHCFLGTLKEAEAFMALGFLIGVTGVVTFGRKVEALQAVVTALPLEKLVVETDCPYLTPEPHRGERNRPVHVELVAKKIASLKGLPLATVAVQTTANARQLYRV